MPQPATLDAGLTTLPPPLKWAGGKRWLVPRLAAIWAGQGARRWVEPFVGGGAVVLGLRPARALLNDRNPHLIAFWRWLQRGLVADIALENDSALFYAHRARFNALTAAGAGASAEAAALFYYLNRTGYNGLCRFNRTGGFNVPFGAYKTIRYTRDFTAYAPALAGWDFTSGECTDLPLDPSDFIYADPPYDVPFTSYSPGGFGWADQVRLAEWLAAHPGPVVASNQATERILALYTGLGFAIEIVIAPRMIACNGDRTPAREMLARKGIS